MSREAQDPKSRIAAVGVVIATYFYFLIYAEFAFLERARGAASDTGLPLIMSALGAGGILGAAGMAVVFRPRRARTLLAWSLRLCALSAGMAIVAQSVPAFATVGFLSGAALGALTVALASVLRESIGARRLGVGVGIGTGMAYFLCNLPWLFRADPSVQCALAAVAVFTASFATRFLAVRGDEDLDQPRIRIVEVVRWTIVLLTLVWFDSAVFYIIQHSPALRLETWEQTRTLWMNAGVHLAGAVVAGVWLDRRWYALVAGVAIAALGVGGLVLGGWLPAWLGPSIFYTAGVSFYSVALVEIPARTGRPWMAAVIFSVAGWIGSALGIGMAQDLARIPPTFIFAAVGAVGLGLLWRRPRIAGLVAVVAAGSGISRADEIQFGREVYIAEGCIHCHSQYVRPQVPLEVVNWGPATSLEESLAGKPPLFGTRRQGPDLARVGNRRSAEWNRLHLIAPSSVSPGSRMPSYRHLFDAGGVRGEALLAYLASLGADTLSERQQQILAWQPATRDAITPAASDRLFQRLCAQCHGPEGRGEGVLAAKLSLRPPNWAADPWRHVPRTGDPEVALYRIIKFGLPGLPMAGHEYLSDAEIVGLARYARTLHKGDGGISLAAVPP